MKKLFLYLIIAIICVAVNACGPAKKSFGNSEEIIIQPTPIIADTISSLSTKPTTASPDHIMLKPIQVKYADMLKVPAEQITNIKLYSFIDNWMGTPYKWGGTNRSGIDCSALVQKILDTAYNIHINRTSIEQFYANWVDLFASTKKLSEGDLVFFSTIGENAVSHVGMYLHNGIFVNSSSSLGVSLARLDDPYWKTKYVAAGRVKIEALRKIKE